MRKKIETNASERLTKMRTITLSLISALITKQFLTPKQHSNKRNWNQFDNNNNNHIKKVYQGMVKKSLKKNHERDTEK